MTSDPSRQPLSLRLVRCPLTMQGHDLGLRPGDLLVGIDGRPWHGNVIGLRSHFRSAPRRVLTFLRNDAAFSVIATTAVLGIWDQAELPAVLPELPGTGRALIAWQVLLGPDGSAELVALRPAPMALAMPLFWLVENRLWAWFATMVGTLALALLVSLVAAGVVWACFALHLWRSGAAHLVRERITAGSRPVAVIAAADAAGAARTWAALAPATRLPGTARAPAPAAAEPAAAAA